MSEVSIDISVNSTSLYTQLAQDSEAKVHVRTYDPEVLYWPRNFSLSIYPKIHQQGFLLLKHFTF